MEIKATLNKPYTDEQRMGFIVQQNHKLGYEIRETQTALEAWGTTEQEQIETLKQTKYNEAKEKAYDYINSGNALYEFELGKHIEATDGNIAKLGLKGISLATDPEATFIWNTKEDENIELNYEQTKEIVEGLELVQANVWTVKYANYLYRIEQATTLQELNNILIDYTIDINNNEIIEETEEEKEYNG